MAIEEIEIEGHVGQDPKCPTDKYPDMLTFTVGVSQRFKAKDSDVWESKTNWYNIVSYDKNMSSYLAPRLFKGDKVVIKGTPTLKTWIKDGQSAGAISITLRNIVLMKKTDEMSVTGRNIQAIHDKVNNTVISDYLDDEIPF